MNKLLLIAPLGLLLANTQPVLTSPPVVNLTVSQNGAVPVAPKATDADGDKLTYYGTKPKNGRVEAFGDAQGGILIYKPNDGYVGPDSFLAVLTDGKGGSVWQTVNLTVGGGCATGPSVPTVDKAAIANLANQILTLVK